MNQIYCPYGESCFLNILAKISLNITRIQMKKTLTLCLCAVAATTLCSCGGGSNNKDNTPANVVSMNDFAKGKKSFNVTGLMQTTMRPGVIDNGANTGNTGWIITDGTVEFSGVEYNCTYQYMTNEKDFEDGVPRMGYMLITFKDSGALSSPTVLQCLGLAEDGSLSGGALSFDFNFVTMEVQCRAVQQGSVTINYPDPQGEYITITGWVRNVFLSNFYVRKGDGQ